ncbi:LysM peptidoglycan-binding domain-containing protein [candidate division KSB1 bacterium]|nr:LysM peptidoglycan-binding domain-containing protein [candidate division KSB1 bacterium]
MKKFIIVMLIIIVAVAGFKTDVFLYAKKLFQAEPTTHLIQEGEYLSMIAKKYYGNADYWRELALINRAPDSDAVFPGEEIVIPSLDVIKNIRRTRWLSRVNGLVQNQKDIIAGRVQQEQQHYATTDQETQPAAKAVVPEPNFDENPIVEIDNTDSEPLIKSSMLYLILGVMAVVLLIAVIGYFFYRRRQSRDEYSLIDDIDLSNEESERNYEPEPDYQDYLKNKRNKRKNVTIS